VKRNLFFLLILMMIPALMQCTKKNPTSVDQEDPSETSWYSKGLVESDNKFGIKLFKEIAKDEENENIFVSPLSVSMALGMTYNGADGETKEAMEKTLELSDLTMEEINESYKNLINLLTQLDPKVQFDIANSIWYRNNLTPEKKFLDLCSEYFYAQVTGMDFSKSDAADIINAWVDENTNGKIKEIVGKPIDPYTVMFLINAIYFKGAWTYQFDKNVTKDAPFFLEDDSWIICRMMEQKALHRYFSNEVFEVVDLPYGDGSFSMTILLPQKNKKVDDILTNMNQENFDLWISSLSFPEDSFNVYIPKFKLDYKIELKQVLGILGMSIAFSEEADFSKMYKEGSVCIDEVLHKTFVEVNEEGTTAAAVTSVRMATTSLVFSGFRADRPFLFVIRENQSGTILFIGQIMNPGSE
jgi:serine protease inhibitor